MKTEFVIASCLLAITPLNVVGQVVNGDFEGGSVGWVATLPAPRPEESWQIDFVVTGGNPDGRAQIDSPFGDSEGEGCIHQMFDCLGSGTIGSCEITFDYECGNKDAGHNTGRVRVYVNDSQEFTGLCVEDFSGVEWNKLVSVSASSCGFTTVRFCLDVDPGNNGYRASFDNVSAKCLPPIPGDFDEDFDVDLDDFAQFAECIGGPDVSPIPTVPVTPQQCLEVFDFDNDDDVDMQDFAALQEVLLQSYSN